MSRQLKDNICISRRYILLCNNTLDRRGILVLKWYPGTYTYLDLFSYLTSISRMFGWVIVSYLIIQTRNAEKNNPI